MRIIVDSTKDPIEKEITQRQTHIVELISKIAKAISQFLSENTKGVAIIGERKDNDSVLVATTKTGKILVYDKKDPDNNWEESPFSIAEVSLYDPEYIEKTLKKFKRNIEKVKKELEGSQ